MGLSLTMYVTMMKYFEHNKNTAKITSDMISISRNAVEGFKFSRNVTTTVQKLGEDYPDYNVQIATEQRGSIYYNNVTVSPKVNSYSVEPYAIDFYSLDNTKWK